MLINGIVGSISVVFFFIFAFVVYFKVVPDIQKRYEVKLTLPPMTYYKSRTLAISTMVTGYITICYIRNKFKKPQFKKQKKFNYFELTIYEIDYDIQKENKINIILSILAFILLILSMTALVLFSILHFGYGWE